MNSPRFETDELTGLWKWPVLLNGDWSQWTDEPCAILFAETRDGDGDGEQERSRVVGQLLRSPEWPDLTAFQLGRGSFLVLAPHYSPEQALLLAQNINRELSAIQLTPKPWRSQSAIETALTWGINNIERAGWNMPRALQATIAPVEQAIREKRFGSINEASKTWPEERDDFWVCSRRDPLTELKSWAHTVALCCRYGDEPVALLMGDVDYLRPFMDIHSLSADDILLQMIAHVLRRFESNDVVAFRFGGDEFLIWVRGQSLERARQMAERINLQVRALEIPVPNRNTPLGGFSLTWGVVAASPREMDLPTLLGKAGELLEQAKAKQPGSISAKNI